MDPPPPPPPHSSSYTSFPILAISILGILTTAILLVSYYVFVIKCCLNIHRSNLLLRLSIVRSRRHPSPPPTLRSTIPFDSRGLDPYSIGLIPTFRFTKLTGGPHTPSIECAVCLTEFQENERLRFLPNCSHAFHIDCIDTWLQSNSNCPLCRSDITPLIPAPHHFPPQPQTEPDRDSSVLVIEVSGDQTTPRASSTPRPPPIPSPRKKKGRKFSHVASMGDECIDVRGKDERLSVVQPMRRSFSMDSSSDRQLYVSVQEILRQNPTLFREVGEGEGSSSSGGGGTGGSGRVRRSFFSFGRNSRNAVLPVHAEL